MRPMILLLLLAGCRQLLGFEPPGATGSDARGDGPSVVETGTIEAPPTN